MALSLEQQKEFRQKVVLTSEELVKVLANLFDEIEPETSEEIDEILRENGYDPDEVGAKMNQLASLLIEKQKESLCQGK